MILNIVGERARPRQRRHAVRHPGDAASRCAQSGRSDRERRDGAVPRHQHLERDPAADRRHRAAGGGRLRRSGRHSADDAVRDHLFHRGGDRAGEGLAALVADAGAGACITGACARRCRQRPPGSGRGDRADAAYPRIRRRPLPPGERLSGVGFGAGAAVDRAADPPHHPAWPRDRALDHPGAGGRACSASARFAACASTRPFVEGARDGFQVAVRIIPYLVAILVARRHVARERCARPADPAAGRADRPTRTAGRSVADGPAARALRLGRLRLPRVAAERPGDRARTATPATSSAPFRARPRRPSTFWPSTSAPSASGGCVTRLSSASPPTRPACSLRSSSVECCSAAERIPIALAAFVVVDVRFWLRTVKWMTVLEMIAWQNNRTRWNCRPHLAVNPPGWPRSGARATMINSGRFGRLGVVYDSEGFAATIP